MVSTFRIGIILLMGIPLCSMGQKKMEALTDLKNLLYSEKEWIKVHVAEYLLWTKHDIDEVRDEFLKENQDFGHLPKYRIGIWRVLAQASPDKEEKQCWIDKIVSAYEDREGADRSHAIETLAKLKHAVEPDTALLSLWNTEEADAFLVYSLWNAAYHPNIGVGTVKQRCVTLLKHKIAAKDYALVPVLSYVLRFLGELDGSAWDEVNVLAQQVEKEPSVYVNLLVTLWLTANPERTQEASGCKNTLLRLKDKAIIAVSMGLAERGDKNDLVELEDWYKQLGDTNRSDYDADVHATVAYAVLKVSDRIGTID